KGDSGETVFHLPSGPVKVQVPKKQIKIYDLDITEMNNYSEIQIIDELLTGQFTTLQVQVNCSKGTYIRQLAEDMGALFSYPACLIALRRETIAEFSVNEAISATALLERATSLGIQNKSLSELGLNSTAPAN